MNHDPQTLPPSELQAREDRVTTSGAAALHDLLDRDGAPPAAGEPLPLLWHWLAFLPRAAQSKLGTDGHPDTTGLLPPQPGRRRMFAGGSLRYTTTPLRIEHHLHRHSTASPVTSKTGRSGPLTFLTLHHVLDGEGEARVWESDDLVYRTPAPIASPSINPPRVLATSATNPQDLDLSWTWTRDQRVDETLLFRFSALTYNAHRIHYDRRYATETEGYPGLVVHGPLQAILLADLLDRHAPYLPVQNFTFRSLAPAYDDGPLQLRGRLEHDGSAALLAAYDAHGTKTMTATATFQEPQR